jgi:hypothetical protein
VFSELTSGQYTMPAPKQAEKAALRKKHLRGSQ